MKRFVPLLMNGNIVDVKTSSNFCVKWLTFEKLHFVVSMFSAGSVTVFRPEFEIEFPTAGTSVEEFSINGISVAGSLCGTKD